MTDSPPEHFMFQLHQEHTPSPGDPEGADEVYKELGILIVAWGRLEGHYVLCLLALMNLIGNEHLGYKLPMQRKERASMWRKAFDVPELWQFKEGSSLFLTQMDDVAEDRDAIAHAIWEPFTQSNLLSVGIVKLRAKNKTPDGLDFGRAQLTASELRAISEKINRLNFSLTPLSQFLMKLRAAQRPPAADILKL